MAEDKKISFSAQDIGVSAFVKQMRQEVNALTNDMSGKGKQVFSDMVKIAKEQTNNSKDQLKIINEQVSALKKKLELEREYSKVVLEEQRKYAGEKQQFEIDEQLGKIKKGSVSDKFMLRELGEQRDKFAGGVPQEKSSVFSDIMKAGLIRDLMSAARQLPNAQQGLDLLGPLGSMAGGAAGAGIGVLAEAATLGQIEFGIMGANFGKEFGAIASQGYQRHIAQQDKYLGASNVVRGLTGGRSQATDLSGFGMDLTGAAELESSIIRETRKATSADQIKNIAAISRAYSMDTGTILSFLSTGRMGANVSEDRVVGLLEKGINRSELPDATNQMTAILMAMGQRTGTPNANTAMQMVMDYNNIGGSFSTSDPRSTQSILNFQNRISNPDSPFAQALSYSVLRQQNPDLDFMDILKKRQEGGITYQRDILDSMSGLTGNESLSTLMFSNLFGSRGQNYSIDEQLLGGRGNIGTPGSMLVKMGDNEKNKLYEEATDLTTTTAKHIAQVNTAFVSGFTDAIEVIVVQFKNRMLDEISSWVRDETKKTIEGARDSYRGAKPFPK